MANFSVFFTNFTFFICCYTYQKPTIYLLTLIALFSYTACQVFEFEKAIFYKSGIVFVDLLNKSTSIEIRRHWMVQQKKILKIQT